MANANTALGALGISTTKKIAKAEVKEIKEYIPAGIYNTTIKEFGTYTSAKGSLMAFAEIELDVNGDTRTLKDYMYIPADQTDEDIKKDAKRAKNMTRMKDSVLTKINGYVEAVGLSLDTIETEIVKNDVSENFNRFNGVACKTPVTAFIKVEHTEGAQYEWKNIVEAVFDRDGMNSAGEDQKEVFLANVEKKPIIEKKAKGVSATGGGTTSKPSSSAAAML